MLMSDAGALTGFRVKGKKLQSENKLFVRSIAILFSIASILENEKDERQNVCDGDCIEGSLLSQELETIQDSCNKL
jgi:hypothetical protein